MTLTKKHFEKIAEIVKSNISNIEAGGNPIFMIDDFANYLMTENLQFDEQKFRNACGQKVIE